MALEWEDLAASPTYMKDAPVRPWSRGQHGKGLIGPDHELHTWSVDQLGNPHHDDVASRNGVNYLAKFDIFPSGAVGLGGPEDFFGIDRDQAAQVLLQQAGDHGLKFHPQMGYYARWVEASYYTDENGKRVWNGGDWDEFNPQYNVPYLLFEKAVSTIVGYLKRHPESINHEDLLLEVVGGLLTRSGVDPAEITRPLMREVIDQALQFLGQSGSLHGEGSPDLYQPRRLDGPRLENPETMGWMEMPEGLGDQIPGWGGWKEPVRCSQCRQQFLPHDNYDKATSTVTCPHCGHGFKWIGFDPLKEQMVTHGFPSYVGDPRYPGRSRWTHFEATIPSHRWVAGAQATRHQTSP